MVAEAKDTAPSAALPAAQASTGDWRLHLGWGVGTLGASLLLNAFAALQAYYLTNVLGISAVTAAFVLMVAKGWDWISNPLMGYVSDRTHTRWGRRRPYLLLGGMVAGGAFALYFSSALLPISGSLVAVVLMLALVGTGYTIFNVPYMAMPSEMLDDYRERTRMFQYRVLFIAVGTLIGAGASQRLAELFGGGARGYAIMGLAFGAAICFFMGLAFFGTARARIAERTTTHTRLADQFRTAAGNQPFMALLGTKFTQLFGLFTGTAMTIYVIKYVLGKENPGQWMLYFVLFSFIAQVLSISLWNRVTRAIEKQRTYVLGTAIFCLASLTWLVASPAEPLWFFCLRAALKGFAAAGLLLMGQSMLPDVIEYDHRRTGLRREGVFSGLYSVVEKVASTFAPSILLLTYAWFGFDSKAPVQTGEAVDGIRLAAAILPCIYFGVSLIPLYFYRLTERELKSTRRVA
jgi:GPH family glycoside/pentoside/hexuronide:cation symporter